MGGSLGLALRRKLRAAAAPVAGADFLAAQAAAVGEVPVGAVVVREGQVIGTGFNQVITTADPTAHAEVVALRMAARQLGNYRLPGSSLYVTIEPCSMCAGALVHARVGRLIYGAREPRQGAVVSTLGVLDNPALNHRVHFQEGLMAEQAGALLTQFFRARRLRGRATTLDQEMTE